MQKCLSPAPVSTTARTPSVADSSSNVSARWSRISAVSELPASGRSIVTRAMPPSTVGADQVGHRDVVSHGASPYVISAWRAIPWATATFSELAEPGHRDREGDVGQVAQAAGQARALGAEQEDGRAEPARCPAAARRRPPRRWRRR